MVEQLVQSIYFLITICFQEQIANSDYWSYDSYFDRQWETALLAGIISCVVYYLLTWYVMSRKLNLD